MTNDQTNLANLASLPEILQVPTWPSLLCQDICVINDSNPLYAETNEKFKSVVAGIQKRRDIRQEPVIKILTVGEISTKIKEKNFSPSAIKLLIRRGAIVPLAIDTSGEEAMITKIQPDKFVKIIDEYN